MTSSLSSLRGLETLTEGEVHNGFESRKEKKDSSKEVTLDKKLLLLLWTA
jgi:hypothetical protein